MNDRLDVVKYLVEHGANVNATDSSSRTLCDYAASRSHAQEIKTAMHCK